PPSRVHVHSIVHASIQSGHGVKSVGTDHLHVRGRCVVSMGAPTAIGMPFENLHTQGYRQSDIVGKFRVDAEYSLRQRVHRAEYGADRVALELLITPSDGV
ncbi:MAG TPA: hypothetical protein VFO48_02520, partial [Vicinamibacterales bacterium]|nr:hypothetical protein [Vicinamibacterales bacterium]